MTTASDGHRAPFADDRTPLADLSVVIPCLDVETVLGRQLRALSEQRWTRPWEVIVADNGSTDATVEVAQSLAAKLPQLRIVDASGRHARQYACNRGAQQASNAVVFIDADDEVAPGFIAAIGDALAEHPIVAARIDHEFLNTGWTLTGRSDAQSDGLQDGFGFLPFGSGGTLGMRRDVFDRLGGFADDMDYAEDIDLCWRAQLAGIPIHFVPGAVLRYRYRPSLWAMYRQHRNFGRASALLYRTYRDRGMQARAGRAAFDEWVFIAKAALRIRSRTEAARWSRRVGRCVGRLEGSLRQRVWFP
jgi:GT2 family glycosyltransferase